MEFEVIIAPNFPDYSAINANDNYLRFFSLTKQSFINKGWWRLIPDFEQARLRAALKKLVDNKITNLHINHTLRADGTYQLVRWINQPIMDDLGNIIQINSYGSPIKERRSSNRILI